MILIPFENHEFFDDYIYINYIIDFLKQFSKNEQITSQYLLGQIYEEGNYIARDINKAIYYYTLAANQNSEKAHTRLGFIYYNGKYIQTNLKKSNLSFYICC